MKKQLAKKQLAKKQLAKKQPTKKQPTKKQIAKKQIKTHKNVPHLLFQLMYLIYLNKTNSKRKM